jgi:oligopeptide transport system permease protein
MNRGHHKSVLRGRLPNALVIASVLFLTVLLAIAVAGPRLVTGHDPEATNFEMTYQPPSAAQIAGTDSLGRDMAARIIAGARISLLIAFVAALINLVIGVLWGSIAGFAGGRTGEVMMRIVDVLYGVPTILVVILLMVYLDQGIKNICLAIGLTYWLNMARLVRAEVLSLKNQAFVQAARALGAGPARMIILHILPNAAGTILVTLTLFIPEAIFTEAFLSYIGLGIPAPGASWGTLASDGSRHLQSAPYLLWWPASAICLTMLAFNITGDAIRARIVNEKRMRGVS